MIDVILPAEQPVTEWSGGITRELYIMPQHSSYQQRNFTLRLSSALVSDEQSLFTNLPEYQRILMPIEGSIKLKHDDEPIYELAEHDIAYFDGASRTESWGKCCDFNVMINKQADFSVTVEYCRQSDKLLAASENQQFIYVLQGGIEIINSSGNVEAENQALVRITQSTEIMEIKKLTNDTEYIYVRLQNK